MQLERHVTRPGYVRKEERSSLVTKHTTREARKRRNLKTRNKWRREQKLMKFEKKKTVESINPEPVLWGKKLIQ